MVSRNSFKFVMLPPQTDTTRGWAKRLAEAVPEVRVIVAEDGDTAQREIADAEAAFGWLGKELLAKATNLRWLQAPQAAPPAGYYYPELIRHPVSVTNFREIFNDHIGAHILAFVLAFARGLHVFIPQQLRREWKKSPKETGDVVHLPEATALIVGVGGIGADRGESAARVHRRPQQPGRHGRRVGHACAEGGGCGRDHRALGGRRPVDRDAADGQRRYRRSEEAGADSREQSRSHSGQRLPDGRRGVACDGARRPVPGYVGQPRDVGRHHVDRALPAPGVLPGLPGGSVAASAGRW